MNRRCSAVRAERRDVVDGIAAGVRMGNNFTPLAWICQEKLGAEGGPEAGPLALSEHVFDQII